MDQLVAKVDLKVQVDTKVLLVHLVLNRDFWVVNRGRLVVFREVHLVGFRVVLVDSKEVQELANRAVVVVNQMVLTRPLCLVLTCLIVIVNQIMINVSAVLPSIQDPLQSSWAATA